MAVELVSKGETVFLGDKTASGAAPERIYVGMGWDIAGRDADSYDLDLWGVLCNANGKAVDSRHVVYYGNPQFDGGVVQLSADNLTGQGDGDDEWAKIRLNRLPADVTAVYIGVNIYNARAKHQDFGKVGNAFLRVVDQANDAEMFRYNLTDEYTGKSGVLVVKLERRTNDWAMTALGIPADGSIQEILAANGLS